MGLNQQLLKRALYENLESITELTSFIRHKNISNSTGEPDIKIFEEEPEFTGKVRHIVFEIVSSEPYLKHYAGVHKSLVIIWGIGEDSLACNYITDMLQSTFTSDFDGNSYRDISSDCIKNNLTRYIRRTRTGKNSTVSNPENDTYRSGIELEIIWSEFACNGTRCPDEIPMVCPLEDPLEIPECPCD